MTEATSNFDIFGRLLQEAERHGSKPAIHFSGETWSYDRLVSEAFSTAGILAAHGVGPGHEVALCMANRPEWVAAFYGAIALGAVVAPLNDRLTTPELQDVMDVTKPHLVISDGATSARLVGQRLLNLDTVSSDYSEPVTDHYIPTTSDIAVVFYTSGTTARPKGVLCSYQHEMWCIEQTRKHWGYSESDTILVGLPLAFVYGSVMSTISCLSHGGSVALLPRFNSDAAWQAIQAHEVTVLTSVPTMLAMLLEGEVPHRTSTSLEWVLSGGARLDGALARAFEKTVGVPVFQNYGLTEARLIAGFERGVDLHPVPRASGRIYDEVGAQIVGADGEPIEDSTPGELWVRGPALTAFYRYGPDDIRPVADSETGWFRTGDLARLDPDGHLFIEGRIKNLIKRGGMGIVPEEVEDWLCEHPDITECAVVAVPDERFGEEVVAVLVARRHLSVQEVSSHCRTRLASYKVPRWISFVDELPKGPTGKLARAVVLDELDSSKLLSVRP